MNENVYVKVDLDRYEDLIIAEERLRALEEVIYNSTEYSEYREGLRISNDESILSYLDLIDGYYRKAVRNKKEEYEKKNKENNNKED